MLGVAAQGGLVIERVKIYGVFQPKTPQKNVFSSYLGSLRKNRMEVFIPLLPFGGPISLTVTIGLYNIIWFYICLPLPETYLYHQCCINIIIITGLLLVL